MKFVVFSLRDDEEQALANFRSNHPEIELTVHKKALSRENMEEIKGHDGVIVSQVQPIPDEAYHIMKEEGIKVFATRSAGIDMYNTDLLKEFGISMCNVPSYSPEAIAEYVVTAGMYLSRNLHKIRKNVEKHDFRWQPSIISTEIRKKTVGILGTGRIGRIAGKMFASLGAKVLGCDIYENDEAKEFLTYKDKDTLFRESDIISIHMPATADNYHMVNEESLATFKKDAILINAARGSIVDTKDLLKALDEGRLAGAVLDTYELEAPFVGKDRSGDNIEDEVFLDILSRDNVIYTPHIAFYTYTAVQALFDVAVEGAAELFKSGDCATKVF